jgi:hypothetical protein
MVSITPLYCLLTRNKFKIRAGCTIPLTVVGLEFLIPISSDHALKYSDLNVRPGVFANTIAEYQIYKRLHARANVAVLYTKQSPLAYSWLPQVGLGFAVNYGRLEDD